MIDINTEKIEELVSSRYIEKVFPSKKILEKFLKSGKRLKVYIGIDPTGPQLHLGHSTNFFLLKHFQELGHLIIFLVGDFTAQIGDPTGKTGARKVLTKKQVLKNCKNYKKQVEKILDFKSKQNPIKIEMNSKWWEKTSIKEMINIMAKTTVGQMIKRDMFQKRIKQQKEIYLHEFLYPLLQGYDSVVINTDIEVGGNDQTFNMMMGRDLVKSYQNKEKIIIATKLLINPKTNEKLMSKSKGNFIALDDSPKEMYGKVMALPDEVIIPCFELCTEISQEEISKIKKGLKVKKINPREVKARLARKIVELYHSKKEMEKAEREFDRVFKEHKKPEKISQVKIKNKEMPILELLVKTKLVQSKSEAQRLIKQGGVKIDDKKIKDWKKIIKIKPGLIIQVGPRKFIKIS